MIKPLKSVALAGLMLLASFAQAQTDYKEKVHYSLVPNEAVIKTEQPVLTEYFSFYCGHCFQFEHTLAQILPKISSNIAFEKNHVDFLAAAPTEVQNALARAYVVGKNNGKATETAAMIFDYIHKSHANFSSEQDIRTLWVINNFDGAVFDQQMNSMPVMAAAQKMKDQQELLSKHQVLTGVPTLVVNGKYKINMTELDKKDPLGDLVQLINYLATK